MEWSEWTEEWWSSGGVQSVGGGVVEYSQWVEEW